MSRVGGLMLEKMHGAGNSVLVVDNVSPDGLAALPAASASPRLSGEDARWLCDQSKGIGADGVLTLDRASAGVIEVGIWNADGTDGGLCGNGTRCAAALLASRGVDVANEPFRSTAGRALGVRPDGDGWAVALGAPTTRAAELGIDDRELVCIDRDGALPRYRVADMEAAIIGMGNPHLVVWCPPGERPVNAMRSAARELRGLVSLAGRVNLHGVAATTRDRFAIAHTERGVGETPACGTGVCAAHAAGVLMGVLDRSIEASCPGGVLTSVWDDRSNELWLGGPTAHVGCVRLSPPRAGRGTLSVSPNDREVNPYVANDID